MTETPQTVSARVVQQDHKLEAEANTSAEALAKHRWHWTVDESNPKRVNFSAYARAVGKTRKAIEMMVHGYVRYVQEADDLPIGQTGLTLQDAIQLESVKADDRDIVHAVAKATGTSVSTTRQHHKQDVDRVRAAVAEAREEEQDWTPERQQEVVENHAAIVAATREARKASEQVRRENTPLAILVIQGDLADARDALSKALDNARVLDQDKVDPAFVEGLKDAIDRVISLAKLVQTALIGQADVDWDAELAKITTGA